MNKVKQSVNSVVADVKHVWRAAEHLVASLSLVIVSVYAGVDAYNDSGMRQDHRVVVVFASVVIGLIGARELHKYFKSVKLDG